MSLSVGAAITKYHRLWDLNVKHLLVTVLEAWKSKIEALTDMVSGEDLLPGSSVAFFSVSLRDRSGEVALWGL